MGSNCKHEKTVPVRVGGVIDPNVKMCLSCCQFISACRCTGEERGGVVEHTGQSRKANAGSEPNRSRVGRKLRSAP